MAVGQMLDLSPGVLVWDPSSENKRFEVYETLRLSDPYEVKAIKASGTGSTRLDGVFTGNPEAVVEADITRADWDDLMAIIAGMTETGTSTNYIAGNPVGTKLSDIAKPMIIKPMGLEDAGNEDQWVYVKAAAPVPKPELVYGENAQQVVRVEFWMLPDSSGNRWQVGPDAT